MADVHGRPDRQRVLAARQIDASNFNKLEVAWRFKTDNLGPRPEYKLEGTPLMVKGVVYTTAGTRRSVVALDAKTGELLWTYSMREGRRAGLRHASCQAAACPTGPTAKATSGSSTSRPAIGWSRSTRKTGQPIASFGTNGSIDLKDGRCHGTGQQIDLETGEIGLHATPTVVKDVVLVGSSFKEGTQIITHNNTKGLVRASTSAPARSSGSSTRFHVRPVRQRHVGGELVGVQRQHRRVDADHGR